MKTVMKNFVIYRYTEIILILLGAGVFIYFRWKVNNEFWRGVGLGLAIMALLTLFADYFAEKRRRNYINGIETFISKF